MDDKEFFNGLARTRGAYKVYPDREYSRIFAASGITAEAKGLSVLDAGCGSGAFSGFLAGMGFAVTGLDISDEMIALAKANITNVRFLAGDIFRAPLPESSFDIVFCGGVLHHVPGRLRECALEFRRVLKPGGRVYFFEPYAFSLNSLLWYKLLSLDRTSGEAALAPEKVAAEFTAAGFGKMSWSRVDGIEHLHGGEASLTGRSVAALRGFVSRHLIPNTYFTGHMDKL
jgi:SAM-dependent methyltransferase